MPQKKRLKWIQSRIRLSIGLFLVSFLSQCPECECCTYVCVCECYSFIIVNNSQIRCNRFKRLVTKPLLELPIQLNTKLDRNNNVDFAAVLRVSEQACVRIHIQWPNQMRMHVAKWLKLNKKFNRFVSCGHKLWKCGTMLFSTL